jgi:hypothetical protein
MKQARASGSRVDDHVSRAPCRGPSNANLVARRRARRFEASTPGGFASHSLRSLRRSTQGGDDERRHQALRRRQKGGSNQSAQKTIMRTVNAVRGRPPHAI